MGSGNRSGEFTGGLGRGEFSWTDLQGIPRVAIAQLRALTMGVMSATAIAETPTTTKDFETKLDRLAEVAIHSGLGLASGQELVMTASTDALPLARLISKHAYKAGASLVTIWFTDEEAQLLRYKYGADASFDTAASMALRGHGGGVQERGGAAGDHGRESIAAVEGGSGEGEPGESGDVEGVPAGAGADHAARYQLDDRVGGDSGVGGGGVSGIAGGQGSGEVVGCDFCGEPGGRGRSCGSVEGA
jgi:hypothetical protein